MPAGLSVFDDKGNSRLCSSNFIFNEIGTFVAQHGLPQEITDDRIIGKRIACFIKSVEQIQDGAYISYAYPNGISIDNNKIQWSYNGNFSYDKRAGLSESYKIYRVIYSYGWY
ncbi:hypothetical protein SELR_pSRC400430 (plasmid) [Selenomonas ruminantium subsp. lactilytica TAM6421]|uniref:Uncharacterized protein n=1 Tax=Selenomonas ruminantium subsp. lactilytica (strain NBRC 103574 / TAM6421) TaxID=927704 RepID=I0GVA7_SELRL|nr:hypothetical protein [Selenomonas ruminantium]BAL84694.1 hypothetical protein SELR_pSRC400430 [Selenomonas ruminantium subsp. lactilytica TAM6421]